MKKYLLLLLATFCLFSCRDESTNESTETIPIGLDTNYEQVVFGQVVDVAGVPISDALVVVNDDDIITQENGLFSFESVFAGNKGTQISATKEGYLYGGYRLYADAVGKQRVEIVLLEAKNLGTINSIDGGSLDITNLSSIDFPSNAFSLNGSEYTGNVTVLGNWIDPTDENMLNLIPGDMTGVNTDSERVILRSFGMLGIELRSDSGEEVQIADDKLVELTYEVPDAILADAPSTIPLWSFDEENGLWIEEGIATLEGNQYVGSVSHFTWWNTDIPESIVEFCIRLVDQETDEPLANQEIKIFNLTGYGCAWGITDQRGIICGVLPEDSELELTVILEDVECPEGNPTYVIGPYSLNDAPIFETIYVDYPSDLITTVISGTVTDCNTGNTVANSTVMLDAGTTQSVTQTDADGNYSQTLVTCTEIDDLTVTAIDLATQLVGSTNLTDLDEGSYTADVSLCEDFFEAGWVINSSNGFEIVENVVCKVKPFETVIVSEDNLQNLLGFECQAIGSCSGDFFSGTFGAISDLQVEILEFGNVGETVEGSFTGVNQQGETIWGSFNAERVE